MVYNYSIILAFEQGTQRLDVLRTGTVQPTSFLVALMAQALSRLTTSTVVENTRVALTAVQLISKLLAAESGWTVGSNDICLAQSVVLPERNDFLVALNGW